MEERRYTPLQVREIFHLEFLRWFSRKIKPDFYALKGGSNLRFFFNSVRYSEDMYIDIHTLSVNKVQDSVMDILGARTFQENLRPFGVEHITGPDMRKAKQTETTQRFKVHLITTAGDDLFTKVEFSRRGMRGTYTVEPVPDSIVRFYRSAPLLIPHYDIQSCIGQKVYALGSRAKTQARDVFDLFMLGPYSGHSGISKPTVETAIMQKAYTNLFGISYEQFRDTVITYLSIEDQPVYDRAHMWDEIQLKVARLLEEISGEKQ